MESDDSVTEILEVPGNFQKPHEIFISEQADWSYENGVKEETDPLCIEEEQDCEIVDGGEIESIPWQPEKTTPAVKEDTIEPPSANLLPSDLTVEQEKNCKSSEGKTDPAIKEDTYESASANLLPSGVTVKREKDSSDLPPHDLFSVTDVPYVKEIYCSTEPAFSSKRRRPALESDTGFTFVKTESSPRHDGYDSDVWPGGAPRRRDRSGASREQRADGDAVELIDRSVACCLHRKRMRFSQMIIMAIMDSPNWRASLNEIYRYTMTHFPGVSHRRNWQNSIRHMLSVSWLFVKTESKARANAHYWALAPQLSARLHEEACWEGRHCCRWQVITQAQRDCNRAISRQLAPLPPPPPPPPLPSPRRCTSKSSTSSQKKKNRSHHSSSGDVRHDGFPPPSGQKNSEWPNSSRSVVDSTTDRRDEVDRSSAPALKPLIARAIMLSPDRCMPLSVIYTYCMKHCPYYKSDGRRCRSVIQGVLESEACFRRLPQVGGGGPDCWTLDTRYKDLSASDICRPSGGLVDDASGKPWEHDHGLYPKQSPLDPDEAGAAGRDAGHSPDSQVTDTASEPDSDTDRARSRQSRERLRPSPQAHSRGGARKRNKPTAADGESELGCSPKRPKARGRRLESLSRGSGPHSDYRFPDKTVEHDVLDIKEEPFCEELPTENICAEGKGAQNMCTTLLNTDCYRTVKIKQEKEEYPVTVKYEMVGTWC